ncbi:hypothetical protein G6514_008525, partial [Epicoccum nigrum]
EELADLEQECKDEIEATKEHSRSVTSQLEDFQQRNSELETETAQLVTDKEQLGQKLCDKQAKLLEEARLKDEATRQNTELEKTISSLVDVPEMLKEARVAIRRLTEERDK